MAEKVISAYLDRVEEGQAILLADDPAGETRKLLLHESLLPPEIHEGSYVRITISTDAEATDAAWEEARALMDQGTAS